MLLGSLLHLCGWAWSLKLFWLRLSGWVGSLLRIHGRAWSSVLVFAELDHHYVDMTDLDHFCFYPWTWSLLRPLPASLFTFAFRVWASSFLWYLADVEHLCPRDVSLGDNVRIYCQYNCTVQPLSPLQGLLDQKGGGGGRTALCLVSMLSVAWLLSHFCYRNHLHIFMAEIDHFHFF